MEDQPFRLGDHGPYVASAMKSVTFLLLLLLVNVSSGQDWRNVDVPVSAPNDHAWRLLSVSDGFNYTANPTEKPKDFTAKWNDSFINKWLGPGNSEFSSGHSYVTNGHLGIHASRKPNTDKVYSGVVSSKDSFLYPLFIEVKAKISGLVLASNVWMLSEDSTQEIDILEAYGSSRKGQEWYQRRLHLSHHVFIREPFQDYQPSDDGAWFFNGTNWRDDFHRIGVYWRDPWHLQYYVDGELVRTVSGRKTIDPKNFTNGEGLNKPMKIIINTEDQDWRVNDGFTPTDKELSDKTKQIMWVDWIRVYKLVENNSK